MIAQLEGLVVSAADGMVILDVGGVGFAVHTPLSVTLPPGKRVLLYTYLHVRENELALYGFPDQEQKDLFEMLLGVSGVGPKAALSVLGALSPDTLRRAILNGQPEALSRAPGVGKKTAEAIVLHLKDKLKRQGVAAVEFAEDDADIIAALTALGFSIVEAQRALQQLPRDEKLSLDEKIRRALSLLGR
ncbi:MAG TPA: Holliday junction branch migration protein RuvA [Anaerolineae bacterium]|nr:Holliday junction branch migration protein RuvA [Anaerolineae bacterium]HQK14561.1 Holliday junction branch migration protein RuvA [Anaerolineae bacterium]